MFLEGKKLMLFDSLDNRKWLFVVLVYEDHGRSVTKSSIVTWICRQQLSISYSKGNKSNTDCKTKLYRDKKKKAQ